MYKLANLITIALVTIGLTLSSHTIHHDSQKPITSVKIIDEPIEMNAACDESEEDIFHGPFVVEETAEIIPIEENIEVISDYTDQEIELIALVTMAEAEGESEEGKRLVIDTILNRVDHERYPDTVEEVIYQPSQFSSMWNGRVDRCYVDEDICELVREEIEDRTNDEVMFFTAGRYSKYGEPMFVEGNHYFSRYV